MPTLASLVVRSSMIALLVACSGSSSAPPPASPAPAAEPAPAPQPADPAEDLQQAKSTLDQAVSSREAPDETTCSRALDTIARLEPSKKAKAADDGFESDATRMVAGVICFARAGACARAWDLFRDEAKVHFAQPAFADVPTDKRWWTDEPKLKAAYGRMVGAIAPACAP